MYISYPLSEDQKWTIPNYIYFRHVVTKALSAENMTIGAVETFGQEIINTKKTGDVVEITFGDKIAKVTTADITAKNGIIHEVDTIFLSPDPPIETPGNLIEVLEKAEKFKKILKAIEDVGLTDQFKNIAVATVFAPSDKVFDELEVASPGLIGNLTKEDKIALISR